ncbi:MAG: hypothetical protein H8E15_12080 [Planctomycetes bacterium]|nr:hypothetical protein [Planctomycetota bacterium]
MKQANALNDEQLIQKFESCELPFEQWDHRTHVKVAFLYLRAHDFETALQKMRTGVQAYNAANRVPEGPLQGYNETTTHAFLRLINAVIIHYKDAFPTPSADEFCDTHPQLMSKHVLRFFYSAGHRLHPDAKTQFVEPDLTPLP